MDTCGSFPVRCFTCGKPIGWLYAEYLKRTKDYTEEHGEINTLNLSSHEIKPTKLATVMDELGLPRYCCRKEFLGHKPVHLN